MIKKIYVLLVALLMSIAMGGAAVAGGAHWANLTVKSGDTGKGLVYAVSMEPAEPKASQFVAESVVKEAVTEAENSSIVSFYAYTLPVHGYKFGSWTKNSVVESAENNGYGALIEVTGSDKNGGEDPAEGVVTANFVADQLKSVTVLRPEYGSITVNDAYYVLNSAGTGLVKSSTDKTIEASSSSSSLSLRVYSQDMVTLTAEGDDEHKFLAWTDQTGQTTYSYSKSYTVDLATATTYKARFANKDESYFLVNNKLYNSFANALTAAGTNGTIIVPCDATITAGEYTIPAGVTLLVPNNEDYALDNIEEPELLEHPAQYDRGSKGYYGPKPYNTLTISKDAVLNVNGSIIVNGTMIAPAGNANGHCTYPGCVAGQYGNVVMESGSEIIMKNGGNLTVWGYISGKGKITAKNGATIREAFQFTDWRGGEDCRQIYDGQPTYRVFPIHQYYIQNIEVPTTFEYGANEILQTALFAADEAHKSALNYISRPKTASDASDFMISMFQIEEGGSLTKYYDGSVDRQIYEVNGGCKVNGFAFSITDNGGTTMKMVTSDYVLPITNNMTINVKNGGSLEIMEDVCMLPDATINVENGATMTVDKELTLYNAKDWGQYAFPNYANPLYQPNVPSMQFVRSNGSSTDPESLNYRGLIKDATLCVDGSLNVKGNLFVTTDSVSMKELRGNIMSNGGGEIKFVNAAPASGYIYQHGVYDWQSYIYKDIHFCKAGKTTATLRNANGTYVWTLGNPAGAAFSYVNGVWTPTTKTAGDVNNDHRYTITDISHLIGIMGGAADTNGTADIDGNGTVDNTDLELAEKKVFGAR